MKLSTFTYLLTGILSASHTLADDILEELHPTRTSEATGLDDLGAERTPFPELVDNYANLEYASPSIL